MSVVHHESPVANYKFPQNPTFCTHSLTRNSPQQRPRASGRVLDERAELKKKKKMVADKGKKPKLSDKAEEENPDQIDEKLVLSIEKLQEVQDELEKVLPVYPSLPICLIYLSSINNLAKKFVFSILLRYAL